MRLAGHLQYKKSVALIEEVIASLPEERSEKELRIKADILKSLVTKKHRRFNLGITFVLIFLITVCIVFTLQYLKVNKTEVVVQLESSSFYFELLTAADIQTGSLESVILKNHVTAEVYADSIQVLESSNHTSSISGYPIIKLNPYLPINFRNNDESNTLRISGDGLGLQSLELIRNVPISMVTGFNKNTTVTIYQDTSSFLGILDAGIETVVECNHCQVFINNDSCIYLDKFKLFLSLSEIKLVGNKNPIVFALIFPEDMIQTDNFISNSALLKKVDFTSNYAGQIFSSINRCSITFTEFDDGSIILTNNDFLEINDLENFYLRSLKVGKELNIEFLGKVGTLKSGLGTKMYSRMPSLLERFTTSNDFNLLIAAVAGLFSFLIGILLKYQSIKS